MRIETKVQAYKYLDTRMLTHALLNLEIECAFLRMRFSESISRGAGENVKSCGAGRNRTDDVLLAKQVLYQLSYSPV